MPVFLLAKREEIGQEIYIFGEGLNKLRDMGPRLLPDSKVLWEGKEARRSQSSQDWLAKDFRTAGHR